MENKYVDKVELLKALADKSRLQIIEMLSCGELCACMILEELHITQPTLSHHMKILSDCGLVNGRKDGKWVYCCLNEKKVQELEEFFHTIITENNTCAGNSECDCEGN